MRLLASIVLASLVACSSVDIGLPDPCRGCAQDEVCEPFCATVGGTCSFTCTAPCDTNPCSEGHVCRRISGAPVCSGACDSTLCKDGRRCTGPGGSCVSVGCTSDAACGDGSFCDERDHACYALEGDCGIDKYCRPLPPNAEGILTTTCEANRCVIRAVPPTAPTDSGAPVTLRPVFASSDARILADDVRLRWHPVDLPLFVFVSRSRPRFLADVSSGAFWAASRAAGVSEVGWREGVDVAGSKWGTKAPTPPPEGEPLYLTLTAVKDGALRAISPPTLFVIGQWKADGAACTDVGNLDGQCAHASAARVCTTSGCARLCESHRQCPPELLCARPGANGLRACGG